MRLFSSALAIMATLLPSAVMAHNIVLPAHGRECFFEDLHKGDRMTVTFQVADRELGRAGDLHIDFWITSPLNKYETFQKVVSNGDYSFDANADGRYLYCFGNEHWGSNTKEVSFNVHGIVYVSEEELARDPIEAEVRRLTELVAEVRDEQSYIVVRERTHRNTAESTNSRVKWWNLFVLGIVVGESLFQVWWLRRFFEVKRVV